MLRQKLCLVAIVAAFFAGCASMQNDEKLPEICASNEIKDKGSCTKSYANSLVGRYKASLPCASCPGIDAILELNADNSFRATMSYQGKQAYTDVQQGTYSFFGDKVVTTDEYKEKINYKFSDGKLIMLSPEGNEPAAELRDNYTFTKVK